jgi:hypothetical protein
VYGLNNFHIMPSDSLKIEIEKNEGGHLHYAIHGDSLIIHGDSAITRQGSDKDIERSYQAVNLYLPAMKTITADNSEITLQGSKDSTKAQSYHFLLGSDTKLGVEENGDDSNYIYFSGFTVHASHSAGIEFNASARVLELQLTMIESAFSDNGASIDRLTIDADKQSSITLKGDNLKKVNLIR